MCTLEALVKLSENYLCTDAITCPVHSPKLTEDIFISTLLLHAFSIVLRLDTFWLDFSPVYKKMMLKMTESVLNNFVIFFKET